VIKIMTVNEVIGARIKTLLQEKGIMVKELAAYIGMKPSNLSMVISGTLRLMPDKGRKVAEYLGVTMDKLFDPEPDLVIFLRAKPGCAAKEGVKEQLEKQLQAYFEYYDAQHPENGE
jgi:transcriptional regulator with XRE-family HTH domain